MSAPIILNATEHASLVPSLVELHIACIERDHMLATFLPPFDRPFMVKWWTDSIADPSNTTFVTLSSDTNPIITGVVQLRIAFSQTEPYTALIFKLMVSPDARKQGIAKRLMARLEEEAVRKDKPLLILDTEVGSPAENVYPKIGYTRVGVIPKYGISPKDGRPTDEVWFYKDLRTAQRLIV